jgi:hypothetical protein
MRSAGANSTTDAATTPAAVSPIALVPISPWTDRPSCDRFGRRTWNTSGGGQRAPAKPQASNLMASADRLVSRLGVSSRDEVVRAARHFIRAARSFTGSRAQRCRPPMAAMMKAAWALLPCPLSAGQIYEVDRATSRGSSLRDLSGALGANSGESGR